MKEVCEMENKSQGSERWVVNSYNEWDPLEEVVVGRLENSVHPSSHIALSGGIPQKLYKWLYLFGGTSVSNRFSIQPAQKELDEFIHILEAEGITVRRPEVGEAPPEIFDPRLAFQRIL